MGFLVAFKKGVGDLPKFLKPEKLSKLGGKFS